MMKALRQFFRERAVARNRRELAQLERKLQHIQSLIDRGRLGGLTYWRLNSVCRRIQRLDAALASTNG